MVHRPERRRPLVRMLAAGALAVLIAACNGNDPAKTSSTTTTAPAAATTSAATATTTGSAAASTTAAASATTAAATTEAPTTAPPLTNAPTTTNPEKKPVSGGTITVGLEGESTGFNPTADAWSNAGNNVAKAIFDSLATYDASGKVVPYLAEKITANADSTVWTITLRAGVKFHDGEPLNADAVKQNFDAVLASAQYKSQLALVKTMKVVDDLNLEIDMSGPWGTFPTALTGDLGSQVGYIAAPAMLKSPDGGRHPIGTGPFKFVDWIPDDHLTVERNPDYWQQPAYLDKVVFKPIPDRTAAKGAFDAGDIDVYYTGNTKEITEYLAQQKDGKKNVTIGAPSDPDMIMMNVSVAPLDDVRVRRALAMSVDVNRLFEYLDAVGVKQQVHGPYPDGSFWYVPTNYPAYDPEGAKKLIDEYVAEKGPVEFDFQGGQDPFVVGYQELMQDMWSKIGAKANIVSKAQSENIDSVVSGKYQVMTWGGIGGGDPDKDYNYFHSGGLNFSRFTTPEIDAALDQGRALADQEARKEQYAIVQKAIGDAVPYIWIGTNQMGIITKPQIHGMADFKLPDGTPGQAVTASRFFLKDVWLEQ